MSDMIHNSPLLPPPPEVDRPPYRAALGVFVIVLAGYVWTLAPTVTFWDAGEFIAAAKILGIPHPPGAPVFVLLAHVWADVVRIGEYAYRTNLMTATFSAGAAALFFLVLAQTLRENTTAGSSHESTVYRYGGALAAVLISAFAFTVWQNSNETEVYMVSSFAIAAICWLALQWRRQRGTVRASHLLLLIVYLQALSVGNHLLTLLVGPAIIGFLWHVMRNDPLPDKEDSRIEWAQWWVVAGVWAILVATGLGSTGLLIVGGIAFLGAAAYATSAGASRFAGVVVVVAAVGVSTYYFLLVRAGLSPFINEADPSTWDSLLAVIRREQYPPRLPWDNPIYAGSGIRPPIGEHGRLLGIIGLQIQNYLQYFDWQWSNGLAATRPVFAGIRLPFTLLFMSLGIYGAMTLRGKDRSVFWLLGLLFLATGPGLVAYMNFKPGFSLGWEQYPQGFMHEVRERDYFFTLSFQVWGLFSGIGLAGLYKTLVSMVRERAQREPPRLWVLVAPVFLIAFLPLALNFSAASRAHGPDARLAEDFAYSLLQSVEPYGIVFTNGDNDTFPLWYAQEVAGVRQDVSVVNLSLGNTDWYIRQLRDNPVRAFNPSEAPWFAEGAPASPPGALHNWTDQQIAMLTPQELPQTINFSAGLINKEYPAGTPLYVKDVLILKLIQDNLLHRPVYFSITAGSDNWVDLGDYLTQEALVLRLNSVEPPDSSVLVPGFLNVPVNLPRTDFLAWGVYRYARLFEADSLDLDPTSRNIVTNLSLPFLTLGQGYSILGDEEAALENFERAYQLMPSPQLRSMIDAARNPLPVNFFGDTAVIDTAAIESQ